MTISHKKEKKDNEINDFIRQNVKYFIHNDEEFNKIII